MKNILLLIFFIAFSKSVLSQEQAKTDSIFKINNEIIACTVQHVSDLEVIFSYPAETMTNNLSTKQIKEIHFASGRVQKFTEVTEIKGEGDWSKVQLTNLSTDVDGLVRKLEVSSKALVMFDVDAAKQKAEEQIKRQAAKLGAHMVLLQDYSVTGIITISGIAYSYK